MLHQALEGSRMFAVTNEAISSTSAPRVAGLGLIRSCVQQPDGTSNLVLQGLARVRVDHLIQTNPYLIASPEPLEDPEPNTPANLVTREALVAKILEKVEKIENPMGPPLTTTPSSISSQVAFSATRKSAKPFCKQPLLPIAYVFSSKTFRYTSRNFNF